MPDFKKSFKPGGARPGGFSRPSFGGGARRPQGRDFGPSESFKTTCSKCHAACEVPFKPNGKKPVFCKNCFVRDDARDTRDFRDSRDARPSNSYEKRSYGPERSFTPAPAAAVEDPRIGAMQRELTVIHDKLDTLIQNLEGAAYSAILKSSVTETPAKEAKPKKAPTKVPAVKKITKKK